MNRRLAPALVELIVMLAACGSGPSPSASPAAPASASGPASASAAPSTPPAVSEAPASGPAETQPPAASPTPVQSSTGGLVPGPFRLTSAAFSVDGVIPAKFTCDGRDISPAMAWTGTPDGTKWLVLLVDDKDAHNFTHWIAYAIAPGTTRLAEGAGTANSQLAQGTNDFGRVGWGGPCPPSGTHRYVFTLYALGAPLGLSGTPSGSDVRAALAKARVLGKASITAKYARGG